MAQFNKPAPPRRPDTTTHQGGPGFTRTPEDELFLLGVSYLFGNDTFYETAAARQARFVDLLHKVTIDNPAWVAAFVPWLRQTGNVRTASVIAACEYVAAGGPHGRTVVSAACQRPDEPAEIIGYWWAAHGRRIPKAVKRGVADACVRLYTEKAALGYDGAAHAIRFGDVLELTHAKPADAVQSELFRWLIDRRHKRPPRPLGALPVIASDQFLMGLASEHRRENLPSAVRAGWRWERIAGWVPGGMDDAAWQAAIPTMGVNALLQNLRNFDSVGIGRLAAETVRAKITNPDDVRQSRVLPLAYLTAWRNTTSLSWAQALEDGFAVATGNIPRMDGRTLILVDVSPSMRDPISASGKGKAGGVTLHRWELAAGFGFALAKACDQSTTVLFDSTPVAEVDVEAGDAILRLIDQTRPWVERGDGTDILRALAERYDRHDRVVILTDEQHGYPQSTTDQFSFGAMYGPYHRHGWDSVVHVRCPVVTFNLGGYSRGVTPNERNWTTIGGLSDAGFRVLGELDRHRRHGWPWDAPVRERVSP